MASILQQTLRGLCYDTGWCYAVFWKLKQQIRAVLTWEDGVYEPSKATVAPQSNSEQMISPLVSSGLFSQPMNDNQVNLQDQIGLSVAKMSYHVYSVGEGIIGRVAFTNKHQWIFSPTDQMATQDSAANSKKSNRTQSEKYPAGWPNQFAAGIKTIAVIAVPQGVVQLGSTQTIVEDVKLVGHVKTLFGTLQNVPGAFFSDLVAEAHIGGVHGLYPMAIHVPQVPSADPSSANITANVMKAPGVPAVMSCFGAAGAGTYGSNLGHYGVGRLPMLLASQQVHLQPQPRPVSGVFGLPMNSTESQDYSPLKMCSEPSFSGLAATHVRRGQKVTMPANDTSPLLAGMTAHCASTPRFSSMSVLNDVMATKSELSSAAQLASHSAFSCTSPILANTAETIPTKASLTSQRGMISRFPLTTAPSMMGQTNPISALAASHVRAGDENGQPAKEDKCCSLSGLRNHTSSSPYVAGVDAIVNGGATAQVDSLPQAKLGTHFASTPKPSIMATPTGTVSTKADVVPQKSVISCFALTATPATMVSIHAKDHTPPQTGIIRNFSLTSKASDMAWSVAAKADLSLQTGNIDTWATKMSNRVVSVERTAANGEPPQTANTASSRMAVFADTVSARLLPQTTVGNLLTIPMNMPIRNFSLAGMPDAAGSASLLQLGINAITGKPGQTMLMSSGANNQLVTNISSYSTESLDQANCVINEPTVDSSSLCTVKDDLQNSCSTIRVIGASTHLLQESLQSPAANRLHSEVPVLEGVCSEKQSFLMTCTGGPLRGDMVQSSPPKMEMHLCSTVGNFSDEQVSCLGQLAKGSDFDDNLEFTDQVLCGKDCLDGKRLSNILCEDFIEGMQPFESLLEDIEPCVGVLSGNSDMHNAFSTELEDFDAFLAAHSGEQEKQSTGSLMPGQVSGDDLAVSPSFDLTDLPEKAVSQASEMASLEGGAVCLDTRYNVDKRVMLDGNERQGNPEPVLEGKMQSHLLQPTLASHYSGLGFERSCKSKHPDTRTSAISVSNQKNFEKCGTNPSDLDKDRSNKGLEATAIQLSEPRNLNNDVHVAYPKARLVAEKREEIIRTGKKRARPVEGCRTRPKDRQQIQDCVRDLREIIPNTTKCSIDALLEKTIEYVSHLQTATHDVGKWDQSIELECQNEHKGSISTGEAGVESGASWAVELGRQGRCPIVVENLSQPCHMLVEMLCEERENFLEIADTIRGLSLTILKGVMETRNNKIWAKFIVKANEDIQRVQVLWSLMQLLEPGSLKNTNLQWPSKPTPGST